MSSLLSESLAQSRWRQDIEVAELIQHLEQPDKFEQWDRLTRAEEAVILKEVDRCRKDFIYAARNYFWITNKKGQDKLFSLWPGQELILEKLLEIKAKGQPQKIVTIKARQLGVSTLVEALIAWRTMFFSGVNALIVSSDRQATADVLFPIMCFILDRMPWWLKPMVASRRLEEGIHFANPDSALRGSNPGLNSKIYIKGATSADVGQGMRLSAVHCSEWASWDDQTAKEIIDEDMGNALVEDEGTFAILESTAKGANRYAHKMWKRCIEMAEAAEWHPLFLPWFFEATRIRKTVVDFRPKLHESRMRDRVLIEWVKCDHPKCAQYHYRFKRGEDISGTVCATCRVGIVAPYLLADEQLYWMEHRRENAAKDDESMKKLFQEMATTAEESFQVSGYQIFGQRAQDFANSSVRPPIAIGDFDSAGNFHGCNTTMRPFKEKHGHFPCFQSLCTADHTWDEAPCQIFEWPVPEATYCCGADIAEGLGGRSCYSVGSVIRYNQHGGGDSQVAVWRSNQLGPINFAYKLNYLGRLYNDSLMAPECNKYDIVIGILRFNLSYPNLYRWKHLDSLQINSSKLGWWTNISSRPRLWQTFKSWLQQELFLVKSHNLAEEMKNFVKDSEEDVFAGGDQDEFDDELMSTMIALYCAHEGDYSDALGIIVPRADLTIENAKYVMQCMNCKHSWPSNTAGIKKDNFAEIENPSLDSNKRVDQVGGVRCPICKNRAIEISRTAITSMRTDCDVLLQEIADAPEFDMNKVDIPSYDML